MKKAAALIVYLVLAASLALSQGKEERRDPTKITHPDQSNRAILPKEPVVEERKKDDHAHVMDKKFVWGFLLPWAAATVLAAEGASCLHYGPSGQIVRHPPCGRSRTYPIYFGLAASSVFPIYKLKSYDHKDRARGINPPKWSRWWAWGLAGTIGVGGMGVRNLARPACPSGTTCQR